MINVSNKLMKAWYELLSGNISVPVYRVDAPASEEGNYVLLRVESDSDRSNNAKFVTNPVVITEVVTKYKVAIKDNDAANIDSEIAQLLHTTSSNHNLPVQVGIQVSSVTRSSANYVQEDDGTFRYHRLIVRNSHRVVQVEEETFGDELITNGSFTGGSSGWNLGIGWTYNSNRVGFSYVSINGELTQSGALSDGARYKVSLNIAGTAGHVAVQLHGGESQVFPAGIGDVSFSGIYIGPGTAGGFKIRIKPTSDFKGSIDNVSVKEIL